MYFNQLTSLILMAFVALVSPFAFAAFPVPTNPMEQRLNRYASYSDEFIAGRCRMNTGAGIDTKAGQEYNSACKASYMGARDEAKKYQAEESAATARIQSLTSQGTAMCGANRSASGQKLCLEQAASNYDEAAKLKTAMSKKLQQAYEKAQKWRDSNAKALKEYQADQSAISAGVRDTSNKANTFRSQLEFKAAAETEKLFNTAPVVSAGGRTANAADGGTSDIN
jgi:hypothetical protein